MPGSNIIVTVRPIIDWDEGISQPPTVENGVITVKIGSPVFIVKGFNVSIICNVTSGVAGSDYFQLVFQ